MSFFGLDLNSDLPLSYPSTEYAVVQNYYLHGGWLSENLFKIKYLEIKSCFHCTRQVCYLKETELY